MAIELENPRKTRAFGIIGQAQAIRRVEAHTYKAYSQPGNGQYVAANGEGKHMGLGGPTPAQAADIPLELERNKMLNLIRKARNTV